MCITALYKRYKFESIPTAVFDKRHFLLLNLEGYNVGIQPSPKKKKKM